MATQIAPLTDAAYTPEQAVLTDTIANEVYAAHYNERKTSRIIIGGLSVLLLGSFASIIALAHKPVINRYIRIDEMGKAQAIVYSDLNYSPREGEVRTYLTDWANYRYTLNRETVAKKYPLNYYFLSQPLATQLMGEDNANHTISQVASGQIEQSDVGRAQRHDHQHVHRAGSGRSDGQRNRTGEHRQALLAPKFQRATHRALDVVGDVLPESQTGVRPG